LKPEGSNLVILTTPDLPWHSFYQDSSTPVANGVTAPSPVIATLLLNALFTLVQHSFPGLKDLPSWFSGFVGMIRAVKRGMSAHSGNRYLLDF
jgi:hypothetical protein